MSEGIVEQGQRGGSNVIVCSFKNLHLREKNLSAH